MRAGIGLTKPIINPWHHMGLLLVLIGLTGLYALTMPRLITLEDAGIFQMACHLGGISHPPGYPLFTAICQQLTFGQTPLSGNLVSVYFALAAVGVLYLVVLELARDSFTALLAALAYGLTRCLWSQGIIIEVYSFAAFQFLLCWWLVLRFIRTEDDKDWYWLCLCAGLALANHWPLFILSCLGFISLLIAHWRLFLTRLQPKILLFSVLCLAFGLSPYLFLFQANPEIAMYGQVTTDNFVPYVLREYYNDNHEGARLSDKLQYLTWILPLTAEQLGWLALPLVICGLWLAPRKLGKSNLFSLCLIYIGSTFILVMLLNFRYEPQVKGVFLPYPVVAMAAFATLFAVGTVWLIDRLNEVRGQYGVIVGLAIFASIVASNYFVVDRSKTRIADDYGRIVLKSMPANALLLVGGDNQIGPIGFLNRVEGLRPDVSVQSVAGLLFGDNMIKRRVSGEARIELLREFKQTTGRRVFSVEQLTPQDVDYGYYYEFEGEGPQRVFLPEIEAFSDYLIELHQAGLVGESHERVLVHSLLVSVARLYSEEAIQVGVAAMQTHRKARLERLQSTLPGKMSSLRTMTAANPLADGLLDFAFAVEAQLGESIAKQHDALVYEFIGRLLLARQDLAGAEAYFQKSLVSYPTRQNAALCEFVSISSEARQTVVLQALQLDASNCINGSG